MELNEEKLNDLLGKVVTEIGAAANGPLVMLGDKLVLYRALFESGPMNSTELADETNTAERYVREWASSKAASGYISYDRESKSFSVATEQAAIFGNTKSPVFMTVAYYAITSVYNDVNKTEKAFRTGEGIAWGDHGTCMIVEPFANDSLGENPNPVGRAFYAFSSTLCVPCSLNREVGLALGGQAGEKRLREVATSAGFTQFKRATETPFNLILEARP